VTQGLSAVLRFRGVKRPPVEIRPAREEMRLVVGLFEVVEAFVLVQGHVIWVGCITPPTALQGPHS